MAEINIEKKKPVWPWILAAIIVLLLIWLLVEAFDRDDDVVAVADPTVATAPVITDPATGMEPATDAAVVGTEMGTMDTGMARFAGIYTSNNMELNLNADGTYTMRESPAGEGAGTWRYDASANALHLDPADGTDDRYFRVEGDNTLIPLNPQGEPAADMAPLMRQGM